jgi:hypothetical protein
LAEGFPNLEQIPLPAARTSLRLRYNRNRNAMPRVKGRGSLERSAAADLFKHTLSRIPTIFGRISYLASLRDANTGTYRHHGLSSTFGRQQSVQALTDSHRRAFQEWLRMPLSGKHADLRDHLAALDEPARTVLKHWRESRVYLTYLPPGSTAAEKELFFSELEMLVDLLSFSAGEAQGPASSPPA